MVCIYKNASAPSPRPPAGALLLDPTGGLCSPDPLTHFVVPPPQYFSQVYADVFIRRLNISVVNLKVLLITDFKTIANRFSDCYAINALLTTRTVRQCIRYS